MSELYSIGQFAEIAGVTLRTLRYYDKIGLLRPCSHTDSGHRLYSRQDFARLQKVLTLKYIGLSLEEISNVIKFDISDKDFKKSLEIQRKIIDDKMHHMHLITKAIDETLTMINKDSILNWRRFVNIINVLNMDSRWLEQYENASNLKSRIRIHELFSTNKKGWMEWYFKQLNIPLKSKVLELGCGDGSFWYKNIDKIPKGWEITLTDFSQGMLRDAKKTLENKKVTFQFKKVDAEDIPYEDESFDAVICNHVLSHVSDIDKVLGEIYRVTKDGGHIYASTVGQNHMKEMRDIIEDFDSKDITTESWGLTEKFQLENGYEKVNKFFKAVELVRYSDNLVVTEARPLIDYIFSVPGNVKQIFNEEKLNKLIDYLENQILKTGGIFITKDTGFFKGIK
ncbi:MAG: methyltransferase domain-containing protein [Clostridiaceae bacterium]|nr:methyltransferase domain-containing protein [Clostridiaceae bacterium]